MATMFNYTYNVLKNANYSRIVIGNDKNKKEFKNVNRHYNCY